MGSVLHAMWYSLGYETACMCLLGLSTQVASGGQHKYYYGEEVVQEIYQEPSRHENKEKTKCVSVKLELVQ